jgi:hypothetical protein
VSVFEIAPEHEFQYGATTGSRTALALGNYRT